MTNELLTIDKGKVKEARLLAQAIAKRVQADLEKSTTLSVERTVARLLFIDGIDQRGVPLPNVVVDQVHQAQKLGRGIFYWLVNAAAALQKTPQGVADEAADGLQIHALPPQNPALLREMTEEYTKKALRAMDKQRKQRQRLQKRLGLGQQPWKYVIVASGNIYEDRKQAESAAHQGADIIAVIRTTGQSLLDYVPFGPTEEGFGGTYATQANFQIMRRALDEVGEKVGRYIQLVNYCSGLCMPEIAVMGALERLDMMLNDAMYGILFRDINMERTFTDQYFSRLINAYAGIIINTGEDNYLTTADSFAEAHTVLASNFINEQMGLAAGLKEWQLGLGHAFELDPQMENGFLYEVAMAQTLRQVFPKAPLKYMPPTKYMTGDIFLGHVQNALFNLASVLTGQSIHLLGMLTEAIHTPYLSDRALSLASAHYIMDNARGLGQEISFRPQGLIQKRSESLINQVVEFLRQIEGKGLKAALSEGYFANVKRQQLGGRGKDGVIPKGIDYSNPFLERMEKELGVGKGRGR